MKLHRKILTMAFIGVALMVGSPQALKGQEKEPESVKKLSELTLTDLLNMQVVTASKKVENFTDAPGIVSTITAEEIKYFGANSLLDILERATSIQPLGSSLFPNNISVMRGDLRTLYDNHVLILINGRPIREGVLGGVNSPIYAAFPLEMIDRIEIVRGPGSVLYGSNAFAGVINIITKSEKKNSSFKVRATGGEYGTFLAAATGTWTKEDFSAKIGAKVENIDGWNYQAMTARPGSPDLPIDKKYGQRNLGLAADLEYKSLTFFGFYTNDTHDMLGILPYATYAGKNKYDRLFLNMGYSYKIKETWNASLNLSYSGTKFSLDDEAAVPVDKHSSADYLGEITVGGEAVENLNVIIGGVVDLRNKNDVGPTDAIKNPYHQKHLSAYAQADYRPVNDLKLIAGAQMNRPDGGDWDLVPRLGAIYDITNEIGIKVLYGQAFRSPWPIEQLLDNPAVVGNPNLIPEKIATTDFQIFYASKTAEASITFYNSMYTNSITRQPIPNRPGVITYANQGTLHTNGLELEGKAAASPSIMVVGSATYQHNVDENTVAVYVPEFMGKIGAFYHVNKDLTIGLFNTLFGKPKENKGAKLNLDAGAVDLLSININYKLPLALPLELNVYAQNLLGSRYRYTEFNRGWVNTLPVASGTGVYGSIALSL